MLAEQRQLLPAWGLLLCGCLVVPGPMRADTITCHELGPHTIVIGEPGLVPGTPEPAHELNACVLPPGFTAPSVAEFFDLMEPNPSNPLLPVSDYFNVSTLGVVSLVSDPLDLGLAARPFAKEIPEKGSERGRNGAVIRIAGVNYIIVSDSRRMANTTEPTSLTLLLTGISILGVSRFCKKLLIR